MKLTARIAALFRSSGSAQSDSVRAAAMPVVSRNTNSDKGATRVKHHAKAASAGSTDGSGLLGSVIGRRALATRGASGDSVGSGAPQTKRASSAPARVCSSHPAASHPSSRVRERSRRLRSPLALLAISLVALFATAAPATATLTA